MATFPQRFQWDVLRLYNRASQMIDTWIPIKAFPSFLCSYGIDQIFCVSQCSFHNPTSWAVSHIPMEVCPQRINISPIRHFADRFSLNLILLFFVGHLQITVIRFASILDSTTS